MRRSLICTCLAAVAWAHSAAPAAAQGTGSDEEPLVRLSWVRGVGAEGCVDRVALGDDVSRRLGRDPFGEPAAQMIEGFVMRRGEVWEASLVSRDPDGTVIGTRSLSSEEEGCASLSEAVGLAVALAIDPDAAMASMGGGEVEGEGEVEVEVLGGEVGGGEGEDEGEDGGGEDEDEDGGGEDEDGGQGQGQGQGEGEEEEEDEGRIPPGVSIAGALYADLVPGFSIAVERATDSPIFDLPVVRFHFGLMFAPEQKAGSAGADFGIALVSGFVGLCAGARIAGPITFRGCLDGMTGAILAIVYSPTPAEPGSRLWGAARGELLLTWEVLPFAFLHFGGKLIVPFVRHAFEVEGRDSPEFQQPEVIPGIEIAGGIRFP